MEALPEENHFSHPDALTVCGTGCGGLWGAVRQLMIWLKKATKKSSEYWTFYAGGGTWTRTVLPQTDFESAASAIPPHRLTAFTAEFYITIFFRHWQEVFWWERSFLSYAMSIFCTLHLHKYTYRLVPASFSPVGTFPDYLAFSTYLFFTCRHFPWLLGCLCLPLFRL